MAKTAINLYSVRELEEPTLRTVERVAEAGYDGVQFSGGLGDATADEVADALADLGLEAVPPHVGIDDLEDDLDSVVETYEKLGVDGVVVPWLPAEDFESREAVEATVDRLSAVQRDVAARGLDTHYHNHAQEFQDVGGETAYDLLVDETDLLLEVDVGWVATGGEDPVELIRRLGDRVEVVHMKDMDTSEERGFREIGEGDVDMRACADAARDVGAEWLVYEHDDPENPVESLEYGAEFLSKL